MARKCLSLLLLVGLPLMGFSAAASPEAPVRDEEPDDVMSLAAFNVQADRLEDFGVRVVLRYDRERTKIPLWPVATPIVSSILPNTAASKAGLKPGERILKSDGKGTAVTLFSLSKWRKLQQRKWAEVSAGKKNVTWTLEVQSADLKDTRIVKLVIPSPAPHWGSTVWRPPEGRRPATVSEAGPLARRAREILDNGQWVMAGYRTVRVVGGYGSDLAQPYLGFLWSIPLPNGDVHRMFVSQQRGQTEIIFEVRTKDEVLRDYLTSPSGVLRAAVVSRGFRGKGEPIPPEAAQAEFGEEKRFWMDDVRRGTRWPFGYFPRRLPTAESANVAAGSGGQNAGVPAAMAALPLAPEFLKLPVASTSQRELFADALAKMGADAEQWAYTETSHGVEDKRVTVVRVDPSKPDEERCVLLKIDGRAPTGADVKQWREDGRDSSAALGDLPPIRNLVDTDNVRIAGEEKDAMVFELPLRSDSREFPADKFLAQFRVTKTTRTLENFVVKMRASFRVAGVVKVTEAGVEARFQSFDPTLAPQPTYLRAGGAVRVALIKFSRDFESARTDFRRVVPFDAGEVAGVK